MYVYINENPVGNKVGDCAVRAIAKALDISWEMAYAKLVVNGFRMGDMPNSNNVISSVLRMNGFKRHNIPNTCPDCFTIREFADEHPYGTYVVGTGSHVVAVIDGNYYDIWDSGDEVPIWYWYREGR